MTMMSVAESRRQYQVKLRRVRWARVRQLRTMEQLMRPRKLRLLPADRYGLLTHSFLRRAQ